MNRGKNMKLTELLLKLVNEKVVSQEQARLLADDMELENARVFYEQRAETFTKIGKMIWTEHPLWADLYKWLYTLSDSGCVDYQQSALDQVIEIMQDLDKQQLAKIHTVETLEKDLTS